MDRFLRRATVLVLLALAAVVWFEKWLPGRRELADRFGEDAVLRFALGLLCIYVSLLVLERHRLEQAFKQVLAAFRDFRAGTAGRGGTDAARAEQEAIRILVAALDSADAAVRQSSVTHLRRLTGQDFGEDRAAWHRWLETRGS